MARAARKAITERMKVECLLWHASLTPFPIRCGICREPIIPMERERGLEWDHIVALALEGDHIYCNLRPLHKACHGVKTRGTKATTAGSDIHKIAKVKRLAKGPRQRKGRKLEGRGMSKPPEGYKYSWRTGRMEKTG